MGRSLPHGSADRNSNLHMDATRKSGRSLTGARIETAVRRFEARTGTVAPSRERGSKQRHACRSPMQGASLPHGSADRNTPCSLRDNVRQQVAPSRERGSKLRCCVPAAELGESLPHESADRNTRFPSRIDTDLPLKFHPAAFRALAGFTPCGAMCATCDRRSWSGLRSRSHAAERESA